MTRGEVGDGRQVPVAAKLALLRKGGICCVFGTVRLVARSSHQGWTRVRLQLRFLSLQPDLAMAQAKLSLGRARLCIVALNVERRVISRIPHTTPESPEPTPVRQPVGRRQVRRGGTQRPVWDQRCQSRQSLP